MQTLNCPSCGAPVPFLSKVSLTATCSYCKSLLMRNDFDLNLIGKVAADMDDMSPLQIGTSGRFQGKSFTLAGKLKVRWDDGTWNEWYALFDDGTEGWLAEFMGWFSMSVAIEVAQGVQTALRSAAEEPERALGKSLELQKHDYIIADVRKAWYVGSEGELPFKAIPGETSFNLDMRDQRGGFASAEVADDEVRCYVGEFVAFDSFGFSNLRELEGWPAPVARV